MWKFGGLVFGSTGLAPEPTLPWVFGEASREESKGEVGGGMQRKSWVRAPSRRQHTPPGGARVVFPPSGREQSTSPYRATLLVWVGRRSGSRAMLWKQSERMIRRRCSCGGPACLHNDTTFVRGELCGESRD